MRSIFLIIFSISNSAIEWVAAASVVLVLAIVID